MNFFEVSIIPESPSSRSIVKGLMLLILFLIVFKIGNNFYQTRPRFLLAKVNETPLYQRDLHLSFPSDMPKSLIQAITHEKLEEKIKWKVLEQFFQEQEIKSSSSEISDAIEEFTNQITSQSGCQCCGIVYPSLNAYLEENHFTSADFREKMEVDLNLKKYLTKEWMLAHGEGEQRRELLESDVVKKLRENCEAISHIVFYTYQQSGNFSVEMNYRNAQRKAERTLERLHQGEAFEKVAKDVSEDRLTRLQGGSLGCIPKTSSVGGVNIQKTIDSMTIGGEVQLLETPDGFHLFKRNEVTDDLVLKLLLDRYVTMQKEILMKDEVKKAKIERYNQ
ncbi:MAG: peptidylprolyl isomerase [Verrucomicrobiota bacterium]